MAGCDKHMSITSFGLSSLITVLAGQIRVLKKRDIKLLTTTVMKMHENGVEGVGQLCPELCEITCRYTRRQAGPGLKPLQVPAPERETGKRAGSSATF